MSFSLRKKLTSASTQKRRNTPRFRTLLFGKETVKTFFYKCSDLGRNESTPQTHNNVSWISSKAELEISFLNLLIEIWVWESGPKIDSATGVKAVDSWKRDNVVYWKTNGKINKQHFHESLFSLFKSRKEKLPKRPGTVTWADQEST